MGRVWQSATVPNEYMLQLAGLGVKTNKSMRSDDWLPLPSSALVLIAAYTRPAASDWIDLRFM